jgi:hypothetical protein
LLRQVLLKDTNLIEFNLAKRVNSSKEPLSSRFKRRDERFGIKKFAKGVEDGHRVFGGYAIPNRA